MIKSAPMQIQMVDLKRQYAKIKEEINAGLQEVMDTGAFINGPPVKRFAENLASYLNVKHVIPCGNGTDALQIALMSLDLQPGDEVITTPFTFVATAEVIALLGLKAVFVDINPYTFNMDEDKLEAAITEKTRCIIPVHLYGQSANMEPILEIAKKHSLSVIEDNAQAIGANYRFGDGRTQKTGTIGDIGCTSFYPSKNLGAYGDAGAMFTNDDSLAEKIRWIANHGQKEKYRSEYVGVNSRLDSFQAVVLDAKLKHLDGYINARQRAASIYDEAFKDQFRLDIPYRAPYSSHVFHQYTLKYDRDRDELRNKLQALDIPSMVYYPVPLHLHKAYENCGYKAGDFPKTEKLSQSVISLPMHTELSMMQLEYITKNVVKNL